MSTTRSMLSSLSYPLRSSVVAVRGVHSTSNALAGAENPRPGDNAPPADPDEDPAKGGSGFLGSIMYGSKKARAEGLVAGDSGSHSRLVGRGKYVHEKITHAIIPSKRAEYLAAAEKYFRTLRERSPELGGVKLTGSWETVVGSVDNFTHIVEYEGYRGYDATLRALRGDSDMVKLETAIFPFVTSRHHQIMSEFSFWPSSPPRDSGYPNGGVFEMRSYQLKPGKLLEWEGAWRRGLEARKRFVVPVGAFFSQVGQLHEVHHIWQYPDMETRKRTREQAWSVGSWSDTVQETVKLADSMKSAILIPTSWSPLR
ncbi:hypothetical protein BCR39DRAFT_564795 [Naematelia encephala]|uniref:NIPSNAP domain-containing protein n=1 Tax=Naematelia encephala TaxID=71784 RepID=A0A1Y2B8G7_9TREE|nr:hypothetical protein BCR39DRAFT_564795 [Naematelia encephala]